MSWIPDRYRELRNLVRRPDAEGEVREEFEAHIAMRTEALIAAGHSPETARAEALRRFGNVDKYQSETTTIDERSRRRESREALSQSMRRELRLAMRSLGRHRSFSAISALTLALGLGGTIAIFTLLHSIILRPLPFPESEHLVRLSHPVPGVGADQRWQLSDAGYHRLLASPSLQSLGVYQHGAGALFREGNAERVNVVSTSATLFDVLRVRPALGRLYTSEETRPGASPVALLAYDYWVRAFGSDRAVVGTPIELEGQRLQIIGVLPEGVRIPGATTDLWLPLTLDPSAVPRNSHYLHAVARLRDGLTAEVAQRELAAEVASFPERFPTAYSSTFMRETGFGMSVTSWHAEVVGELGRALWILLGSVVLVLLIAAANVVNLVLVRAEARRREVAVRRALGAERRHLAWHFLAEGLSLSAAAGVAGVALAWGALRVVVARAPIDIPRLNEVSLGLPSLALTLALVTVTGIVFGIAPLWHDDDGEAMRDGGRGATPARGRRRTRNVLVVAQVALSLVLLASAALLLQSAAVLRRIDPGFRPERAVAFDVSLPWGRYTGDAAVRDFHRELAARLRGIPGVREVGAGTAVPLGGDDRCALAWLEGRPLPPGRQPACVGNHQVSPGYFGALGIPVRGRERTWDDEAAGSDGVVVTAALARRLWPGEEAIGKGVKGGADGPPYYHVVGVSGDFRTGALDGPPLEAVFFPLVPIEGAPLWSGGRNLTVVVRSATDSPASLLPAVRAALHELDPRVPVANVRPMEAMLSAAMARTQFVMLLLAVAAAMALTLSAVGMYGVVSHLVGERRGEIGVRMALGARAGQVRAMVVRESVTLAGAGVVVGLVVALVTTRLLRALLHGVSPTDPLTLALVSAALLVVALAASYLPARRASRADPSEALRSE